MAKHPSPMHFQVDRSAYAPDNPDPSTFYGLPQDVQFCRRCVISNQRPSSSVEFKHRASSRKSTIHFDENGVCDACQLAERKEREIDWEARAAELKTLCDRFRRNDGSYDCLVPGSGGKDSIYAAHMMKYELGMNPLTVTWAPHIYTDWGWANHRSWIHSGFDNYLFTPNGRIHRLLTRLAVENLFHPFQPFILGQKNLAPKMAAMLNIPLVIYGENEAEYGNPLADAQSARRSYEYFAHGDDEDIFLGGESLASLKSDYGLTNGDLAPYMPAKPDEMEEKGIEVHYLGYYMRWHPQSCYYYAVDHANFQASPERTPGTYSKYNSIDDRIDDFHYYTTWVKFGLGRASYDAAQEVRSDDIERDEAVALVRRYDGEFPRRFADEIFSYLSLSSEEFPRAAAMFEEPIMDHAYFMKLADKFRSPHLWALHDDGWRLRKTVFN